MAKENQATNSLNSYVGYVRKFVNIGSEEGKSKGEILVAILYLLGSNASNMFTDWMVWQQVMLFSDHDHSPIHSYSIWTCEANGKHGKEHYLNLYLTNITIDLTFNNGWGDQD